MITQYPQENHYPTNRIIAETITLDFTGKDLADKIEYFLNTIDDLVNELQNQEE